MTCQQHTHYHYLLGMHAFGLEEAGDYDAALEYGQRAVAANPADISEALAELNAQEPELLAVNGGDGTVAAVLTSLYGEGAAAPPPPLALLRGGTTNMTAGDLGLSESLPRALARLQRLAESPPARLPLVRRPILQVELWPGGEVHYGLFFGAAELAVALAVDPELAGGAAAIALPARGVTGVASQHHAIAARPEGDRVRESKGHGIGMPRADSDAVFLAARPVQAQGLRPQLQFHRAADLQIYTTSHAWQGSLTASQVEDMRGIRLADIPWMVVDDPGAADSRELVASYLPKSASGYARLYAMGMDALRLVPHLKRLQSTRYESLDGSTGNLYMDESNQIHRQLVWLVLDEEPQILGFTPRLTCRQVVLAALGKVDPDKIEFFLHPSSANTK